MAMPETSRCHSCGAEIELTPATALKGWVRREVFEAALRVISYPYAGWQNAGGVNNCKHGYSEGLHCKACDLELIETAIAAARKELER